ncbi:LysR family transcriptional regulator [Acidocella sp.]|uniref:LysR family transcriptional regulator n=1 Tax=Acidocella sp. TaxID=50710 RepID=UPI002632856C|nr:LysR family transcriptional regulator [Acidocella sp.]
MSRRPAPFRGNLGDVDLRLLRLFATVAEAGGFTAAEAELQVGLSTISKQLKALETRLGVTLCRRGRGGFALTDQGRSVLAAVRQLLSALEGFRERINNIHTEITGDFNLGLIDTLVTDSNFRLPRVLAAAKRRAPRAQVNICVDPPNLLEKAVLEERLHAAIVPVHQRLPGLNYRFLYAEQNNLYCAETHPLYSYCPDEVPVEMLMGCEVVGRSYAEQDEARQLAGGFVRTATANDVEGVALLVLTGRYIGYLPDHYVRATHFALPLRPVQPRRFGYAVEFELATRARAPLSPSALNVLTELAHEYGLAMGV